LKRGPQAGVIGQRGVRSEIGARSPFGKNTSTFFGTEDSSRFSNEIHGSFQLIAIDYDFDRISIAQLADRSSGQSLRRNVTDARARRQSAESRVCEDGHMLAESKMPERRG